MRIAPPPSLATAPRQDAFVRPAAQSEPPRAFEPSPKDGARRSGWGSRLEYRFWEGMELVLRWIFLDACNRRNFPPPPRPERARREPQPEEPASAYLGHGCPGPGGASVGSVDPFLSPRGAKREVLVAGRSPLAERIIDALQLDGARVHAIAIDIEDCLALLDRGVVPHRDDDLRAHAAGFDLVVSTDLMQAVDARVLTQLRDSAVVLDLAGPPGSVDFQTAKALGRAVTWAPPDGNEADDLDRRAQSALGLIGKLGGRPSTP